jgi:CRP-like cAMP-binding protein
MAFSPDSVFERRFASKDSVIVRQGDFGNEAFLIQSGTVKVFMEDNTGKKVDLGKLDAGQIFGEMALVAGGLRGATVEALVDCNLIVLTRETLNTKLKKSDPTVRAIVTMLMKRLQQGNNALLYRAGSIEEMLEMVKHMYNNLYNSLPPVKKQSLENLVRPRLEDLLNAIKTFQEKSKDST